MQATVWCDVVGGRTAERLEECETSSLFELLLSVSPSWSKFSVGLAAHTKIKPKAERSDFPGI
jgi:hypothetical protein